jgi:hypothetical protein
MYESHSHHIHEGVHRILHTLLLSTVHQIQHHPAQLPPIESRYILIKRVLVTHPTTHSDAYQFTPNGDYGKNA